MIRIFNDSDAIFLAFGDSLGKRATNFSNLHVSWSVTFIKDTTIAESEQRPPQFGDVYKVVNKKPFRKDEFYEFTLKGQGFDQRKLNPILDKIAVVPNPYVGAASWEPVLLKWEVVKDGYILCICQVNVQSIFTL